ncbi:probable multidrug resistance-associated protein lethal(2)03659 [Tenebrio molitor]|uniref:probable multidrug resistance-associated protein lethal(2)03659 n=1 Tax=Tenebrio molitor TaxID=7067 RepID=UPI0036248DF6
MGELIGIIGASGSGKSTLLQTILEEVDPMEGSVDVRGVVSYASQDTWFFSDSIRNNILFGKAMNRQKYHEVIKVCALEHDLSVLPFGDGTLVGEQGAMLSGGQKARISLARAIYRDADIYLLDDPLSAVDAHVAQHIFNECIVKYLKDKCVILVTHQVQYLKNVPRVYQLNEGKLCGLNKSKELQPSTFRVVKNIEQVSDAQTHLESLKNDEEPSEVKEHRSTGSTFKKIYGVYFRAGGNWLVTSVILFAFVLVQYCATCIEFFLSHWVQEHEWFETESERMLISHNCIYIYSGLLLCLVLVTITATLAFVHYCMMASKNLHNSILGKIIDATMTFFNNHPSGRILNRFSKDIGNVDEFVPLSLLTVIVTFLNLVAMFVTICIMNYWMILPTDVRVGNIGLALIQLFQIELIQYAMKVWSDLETQMTSVERVNDYTELTPEIQSGQVTPPQSWPSNGNIDFNKISMKYAQNGPFVLYNVSFKTQAGEKIGIVGRTGAGKTFIVSALFRLYDFDGSITIDEVDSKSISLNDLRSKIAIIPQDPVLFLGTLRKNLDLFDEFDDSQLWSALEDVKLKDTLSDLPSGLDTMILEGGENFSVGQKQLFCLVRAMLRNVKIVVMDEATANVDLSSDSIIQATIRRRFRQCTVITIAHRLDTVMDSDKILVLESGRVVEFDTPDALLQNVNGFFYNYVKKSDQFG